MIGSLRSSNGKKSLVVRNHTQYSVMYVVSYKNIANKITKEYARAEYLLFHIMNAIINH